MYLPDGCDSLLTLPEGKEVVQWIAGNRERTVIAVVCDSTLHFYLSNLKLLVCVYRRDKKEQEERGDYRRLYWRHNAEAICVTTSKPYVYVYSVDIGKEDSEECFNYVESAGLDTLFARQSPELFLKQRRPKVSIQLAVVAKLESIPTSIISLRDELLVCLADGWVHRLSWAGEVLPDLAFNIRNTPLSNDLVSSKVGQLSRTAVHIVDIAHCPMLGGICAVLSDGRAVLLLSDDPQTLRPAEIVGIWAQGLTDACCLAPNHKFRMVYFGTQRGEIAGYSIDETNGSFIQVFRVGLTIKNGMECLDRVAAVKLIQVLPTGPVFAAIWELKEQQLTLPYQAHDRCALNNSNGGGSISDASLLNGEGASDNRSNVSQRATYARCSPVMALFSPFGEQWWNSLNGDESLASLWPSRPFSALEWGPESLQLWVGMPNRRVAVLNLVRSMPILLKRVLMVGSDRLYMSPAAPAPATATPHTIWEVLKVHPDYLAVHWPIRFAAMDSECNRLLAVAGQRGFCYYNFKATKWRIFRKEMQERSLLVTGGLVVIGDLIVVAASLVGTGSEAGDKLYVFDSAEQLDLDTAASVQTQRVLLMNLSLFSTNQSTTDTNAHHHHLITFDVTATICVYALGHASLDKSVSSGVECVAEVKINELLPHPSCVISVQLTQLNHFPDTIEFSPTGMDSLLVNVAGHLLVLSPMQQGDEQSAENGEGRNFQLHPPALVASCVERVWAHSQNPNCQIIPFLNKALWINCGCRGVKVWLPLSKESADSSRSFISRRIMLPIELGLYPLAIGSDCLILGVECSSMRTQTANYYVAQNIDSTSATNGDIESDWEDIRSNCSTSTETFISVHNLSSISELFLHRLLKQLLMRNLGSYALTIAFACNSLPYFSHMLELLLHEVLDEESTSSEPIPDPLLPTVVAFVHEFPQEYLQTIIHCARKTELAFWNLLFSVSHSPRQLFKMCLEDGQLETATSCLILLQSVEPLHTSAQFAMVLLEEALTRHRWALASEIVRFLRSIDGSDFESTPESPLYQKLAPKASKQMCGMKHQMPEGDGEITGSFDSYLSYGGSKEGPGKGGTKGVTRQSSVVVPRIQSPPAKALASGAGQQSSQPIPLPTKGKSSVPSLGQSPRSPSNPSIVGKVGSVQLHQSVGVILNNHAVALVADFALRDLAAFASHLEFDLVEFFSKPENSFAVPEEEFPLVLMKLHSQFSWPYPVDNGELRLPVASAKSVKGQRDDDTVSTTTSSDGKLDPAELARRVFEQLCLSSRVKGTRESEAELRYLLNWLSKTNALEWIYLLCIMKQDASSFREKLLSELGDEKRVADLIAKVKGGTLRLYDWATTKCPSYLHSIRVFKEFVES